MWDLKIYEDKDGIDDREISYGVELFIDKKKEMVTSELEKKFAPAKRELAALAGELSNETRVVKRRISEIRNAGYRGSAEAEGKFYDTYVQISKTRLSIIQEQIGIEDKVINLQIKLNKEDRDSGNATPGGGAGNGSSMNANSKIMALNLLGSVGNNLFKDPTLQGKVTSSIFQPETKTSIFNTKEAMALRKEEAMNTIVVDRSNEPVSYGAGHSSDVSNVRPTNEAEAAIIEMSASANAIAEGQAQPVYDNTPKEAPSITEDEAVNKSIDIALANLKNRGQNVTEVMHLDPNNNTFWIDVVDGSGNSIPGRRKHIGLVGEISVNTKAGTVQDQLGDEYVLVIDNSANMPKEYVEQWQQYSDKLSNPEEEGGE